jgi:hypothetical protein
MKTEICKNGEDLAENALKRFQMQLLAKPDSVFAPLNVTVLLDQEAAKMIL